MTALQWKWVLMLAAVASAPGGVAAQNNALESARLDAVYERFARAYRLGSVDSVAALYTNKPLYLPGSGPIYRGQEELRSQFDFLRAIRERSATAEISFESIERGFGADVAWDVGYYTLQLTDSAGNRQPPTRGKFATIWRRDAQGRWRIHVDSFSPAPPK